MPVIGLITDLGTKDYFVPSMKGEILSINPEATIVDLTHEIPKHNIEKAAFQLVNSVETFPKDSTFVAVVDPGVGTERSCIFVRTENCLNFVGPDNGVFSMVAEKFGIEEIREVTNRELMRTNVTNTFHGRDIMAPVAAHISKGVEISKVGPKLSGIKKLDFEEPVSKNNQVVGKIINIDDFGNIVTNIKPSFVGDLIEPGSKIVIEIGPTEIVATFVETFGNVDKGEKLCYKGSANFLEIAKNQESLAEEINAKEKDELKVWINRKNKQEKSGVEE